jgi:hypothetical protein
MTTHTLDRQNAAVNRGFVDRNCKRVQVTLALRNEPPITCDGLEFHSMAGEAMVVHKTPRRRTWQVTEPVTGLLIGSGYKTRNEAMIHAQERVNRRPGCLREAVAMHIARAEG